MEHVPLGVVALFRLLGGEHLAQILAEIGCDALLVVNGLVLDLDRQHFERVADLLGDEIVAVHLVEHGIAAVERVLGTTARVV